MPADRLAAAGSCPSCGLPAADAESYKAAYYDHIGRDNRRREERAQNAARTAIFVAYCVVSLAFYEQASVLLMFGLTVGMVAGLMPVGLVTERIFAATDAMWERPEPITIASIAETMLIAVVAAAVLTAATAWGKIFGPR